MNFRQLEPILKKYHFEIVDLEGMRVSDQILLFQNMKILLSVHGAGLTNMIFSDNLKIIELIGNVDQENDFQFYVIYYILSQVMKHQYSFLECECEGAYSGKNIRQFYNVRVNIKRIEKLISSLIEG